MSVVFDPFTGQIIDTGSSGSGPTIGGPVAGADPNAILVTDGATNLANIQLDNGEILIGKTGDAPVAATLTGTDKRVSVTNGPNSITLSTPQDIDTTSSPTFANVSLTPNGVLDLTASGILNIGTTQATTINIGNSGTTVQLYGETIYQNVTNLNVTDKNITLNNNGLPYSSFNSGLHIYDGGVADRGYFDVTAPGIDGPGMDGWKLKAPYADGVIVFKPGSAGFTIDQGSHNPITIATTANGLSVGANQELSLGLATYNATGALSSTDWNTFNNKQDRIISKVKAYDLVSFDLPIAYPVTVDGHSVATGDAILFGALSSGNNKIYVATVSGAVITWEEDVNFVPNINDYVAVEYGNSFAQRLGVFDGTSFKFNETVRYFHGKDYFEQSALYTANINPDSENFVFSLNIQNSENMIVDYSIVRGSNKTTGTLYITANSSGVEISDIGVDLASVPSGVTFSPSLSMGVFTLNAIADSGSSGILKYNVRRWADTAGGPGGPPSYSGGGGGSSYFTVQETSSTNPTVTFANINTLNFDNDTGFNVTADGANAVKISLGSTFKTWNIDNGTGSEAGLVAEGEDTVTFVAGNGIEFEADNTSGSKTFTINSTGSSTTPITLQNNVANINIDGFVIDPTIHDGFEANIVIKRDVPSSLQLASYNTDFINKAITLSDGSSIFWGQQTGTISFILKKYNVDGTENTSFISPLFNNEIVGVIDVTENSTNSVLLVYGAFTSNGTDERNRICFIDGNTGSDLFELYDGFGISSGGSGFGDIVRSITKIKYSSNIPGSSSPYGYLIVSQSGTFNGMFITSYNFLIVSCERGGGYFQSAAQHNAPNILISGNKLTSNVSFSINETTSVLAPWSNCSYFLYVEGGNNSQLFLNDVDSTSSGYNVTVVATNPFINDYGYIRSIDTNVDGSVIFISGWFEKILKDNIIWVDARSLAKLDVNTLLNITIDETFNPLSVESTMPYIYNMIVNDTTVKIGGAEINNVSSCKNFCIFNYDGTVNLSQLNQYGAGFTLGVLLTFTENAYLQYNSYTAQYDIYAFSAIEPASYITKMYGCNDYVGITPNMKIKGYDYYAGIYPGVTFSIDSITGQVKYTSTNVQDGTDFTMKYLLTKL